MTVELKAKQLKATHWNYKGEWVEFFRGDEFLGSIHQSEFSTKPDPDEHV